MSKIEIIKEKKTGLELAEKKYMKLPLIGKVKRPSPWGFLIIIGILAAGGTIYYAFGKPKPKINIEELTIPVKAQNLSVKITASATVVPIQSVNISPKTSGRLEKLLIEQGDRVAAGQLIAMMENKELSLQATQAKANLEEAKARLADAEKGARSEEIAQAEARVKQAESRLAQATIGRPEEVSQLQARLTQANAKLAQVKRTRPEEISQAKAKLKQAEARLAQAKIGRPEEVSQLQARLTQANAKLAQVKRTWPQEISQAKARLKQAESRLKQAQTARPEEIEQVQAQIEDAQGKINQTKARLDSYEQLAKEGAITTDQLRDLRTQHITAQANLKQAQKKLEILNKGARIEEINQLEAAVSEAKFALAQIENRDEIPQLEAAVAEAKSALAQVIQGQRKEEISQLQAAVSEAKSYLAQIENRDEIPQLEAAVAEAKSALAQVVKGQRKEEISQLQAAVSEAKSYLAQVENKDDIPQLEAAVWEAKSALAQVEKGKRKEEISQLQAALSESKSALEQLKNGKRPEEINQLKAVVNAAKAKLESAEVELKDTEIRAPFAGIVTQKYANEGAFVTPTTSASSSNAATSTSIIALARDLEIKAKVPEVDVGRIKEGQIVEIMADAYPGKTFKGEVRLVAPEAVIEQNVTSFEVRVKINTGQAELRSGMNVNVTFIIGESVPNALVVPTVAIVTEKGQTGVLVPNKNSEPEFKPVTIGASVEDQTQIISGLKEGDRVFLDKPKDKRRSSTSDSDKEGQNKAVRTGTRALGVRTRP